MHVVVVSLMIMVYFVEVYIEKTDAPVLFTTINEEEVLELIIAALFFIETLWLTKIKNWQNFPFWIILPFLLIAFGLSRLNYFDRVPDPNNIRLGSGKFFIFLGVFIFVLLNKLEEKKINSSLKTPQNRF